MEEALCAYLRLFVEGPRARGGSGSLSKIICREARELRKAPCVYLRSFVEGPRAREETLCAYLRSFVEGPKAEESPWCLSKIICRGPQG